MASRFKLITQNDIKIEKSRLNQLIDIIASDISDEKNRRKYPSFITGLTTPITSSLFQTIYDQDVEYQSSNAMLDTTFGVYASIQNVSGSNTVVGSSLVTTLSPTIDSNGKLIFSTTTSTMMREKINVYKQYAQTLLGDANSGFYLPFENTDSANRINEAIFINVKRLFKRDNIYKGSFGIKLFDALTPIADATDVSLQSTNPVWSKKLTGNLFSVSSDVTPAMIIDADGASNFRIGYAGEVGSLYKTLDSGVTKTICGLIFYDAGIIVLDVNKIFTLSENVTGIIDFPDTGYTDTDVSVPNTNVLKNIRIKTGGNLLIIPQGKKAIGGGTTPNSNPVATTFSTFLKLATLDDIIDHFCMSRFPTTLTTAIAFQNETIINSTIYYCNASPDEFNYSTNPSYTDTSGKIQVVEDETDVPFSYITTIGLYNSKSELLAVAKLSRPIEKNSLHNLSVRVRLDY
jgi:hypothetical protein